MKQIDEALLGQLIEYIDKGQPGHIAYRINVLTSLRKVMEQPEQSEPVAKVRVHTTGGNAGVAWSAAPLNAYDSLPPMKDGALLFAQPPRREPLSDDQTGDAYCETPPAQPDVRPGEAVITGAIYDFAGFLTTRDVVIEVGSTANASPVAELVDEWCQLRDISPSGAMVENWQDSVAAPPAQTPPPRLTDGQIKELIPEGDGWKYEVGIDETAEFAHAIESAVRKQFGVKE